MDGLEAGLEGADPAEFVEGCLGGCMGREAEAGAILALPDCETVVHEAIESFNADKPFDQFLTEQIAGDLLEAKDIRNGVIGFSDYAAFRVRDNGQVAALLQRLTRARAGGPV